MLKVNLHEPRPLKWWYEQYKLGRINMDPTYQRRSYIWSTWKRAHLIDSIINDFDIPKFYVANFLDAHGNKSGRTRESYAIIDGKQRFQTIFDFFEGLLKLNPTAVWEDSAPEMSLSGWSYVDLARRAPHLARKIDTFIPTVMDVITDTPGKIEELFVRLNSGEAATGAEKRNAMGGPVPAIVRELVVHPFFQRKIRFETKRMQEYNLASKLLLIEYRQGLVDTKAKNLDDFAIEGTKWEENQPADDLTLGPYGHARDRVYDVLDRLVTEFVDKDKLLASAGPIPVYYWLARQRPDLLDELHDFLEDFTVAVKEGIAYQREHGQARDQELAAYYTMQRTTNDAGSLEGRYKILVRRLEGYMKPRPGRRRVA